MNFSGFQSGLSAEEVFDEFLQRGGSKVKKFAAGTLQFYDDGCTILLGKEFRENYNDFFWMEHGGGHELGESPAMTAWRETYEETAGTTGLTLEEVEEAERKGYFVEHFNEKSGVLYRMYCIKMKGEKPDLEAFRKNARLPEHAEHVEKVDWYYFDARDVIFNQDGTLPGIHEGTREKIYSTMLIRLDKLSRQPFLIEFIGGE